MTIRALLNTVLCLSTATACTADTEVSEAAGEVEGGALVGRYQFVFDDARRKTVYGELERRLSGEALEAAKREVDHEAEVSRIEFRADGTFLSFIGDKIIAEKPYRATRVDADTFEVAMDEKSTLVEVRGDALVMADPVKGDLTFARAE